MRDLFAPIVPPVPREYRVVEVADEWTLPAPLSSPAEVAPPPRRRIRPPIRKSSTSQVPYIVGGVFAALVVFVVFLASFWQAVVGPPRQQRRLAQQDLDLAPPVALVRPAGPRAIHAVVPRELADGPQAQPPREVPEEAALPEDPPGAAGAAVARETFGTAVEFVRNTREASRIARAERKLVFHLHVSGNFEQAAFT